VTAREQAEAILRAAIAAAEPAALVRRALEAAPELSGTRPVRLVAIGKAAPSMAEPAYELLGDRVRAAVIAAPAGTRSSRPTLFGAHPLPDESSRRAGGAVMDLVRSAGADELVLVLLSGGASAIAALPVDGVSMPDYADCVDRLLRLGADIRSVNAVRRHIDQLKGGRMAVLAAPATVLGIVLSDVVGDPLEVIASGPLTPDESTAGDALDVLRSYGLLDECAPSIRRALERAAAAPDDARPDRALHERVRVRIAGGNDVAVNGAADRAAGFGYRVRRAIEPVTGPAAEAGARLASEARLLQAAGRLPACIVAGGETTVAVAGSGTGGRNQELVLSACVALGGVTGITLGSIATDGVDGPTPAAGAIADAATLGRAAVLGLDAAAALADNDSHGFFERVGGLIFTGPTGTNVNDVQIALITDREPPLPRA
jgi:glycerate 2-kinase